MSTRLDVINIVLTEFGRNPITNVNDSPNGPAIEFKIIQVLPEMLRKENWVWTLKYRSDSTPLANNIAPQWNYNYQLPADYGRLFTVLNHINYLIIDDRICADYLPIQYYYNTNALPFANGDYTVMSPEFLDGLGLYVAWRMAPVLTNDLNLTKQLFEKQQLKWNEAVLANRFEQEIIRAPYNDFDRVVIV